MGVEAVGGIIAEPRPAQTSSDLIDAYWRAANYLSVGQIYLLDNPLLASRSQPEHVKPRLLGHFGTTPGLNLVYAHLNRAIQRPGPRRAVRRRGRATAGPDSSPTRTSKAPTARSTRTSGGRGRAARALPAVLVPGRDPEPRRPRDAGLDPRGRGARLRARARVRRRVRQPRPPRRVRRRRRRGRDGPAGRRAGTRTSSSTRGRTAPCCPILHLNGYKIANPTVLARIPEERAGRPLRGVRLQADPRHGRFRRRGAGRCPPAIRCRARRGARRDRRDPARARGDGAEPSRPTWPMIVLRTPKGWTGPKEVDGLPVEGTWRSHQVPMTDVRGQP